MAENSDYTSDSDNSSNEGLFDDAYDVSMEIANEEEDEDVELIGAWEQVKNYRTTVEIDGVDKRLLALARQEIPVVLQRLKQKIYGNQDIPLLNATRDKILNVWLNEHLLGIFRDYINKTILPPIDNDEIIEFLQIELCLSFYKCSPSKYFSKKHDEYYLKHNKMDYSRYMSMLKALSSSDKDITSSETWNPVFHHDRDLSNAMDLMRRTCAEIGFVSGTSFVGLDDDLLRLRSKLVQQSGFSQINNPNKGLGVVHHGAVSVVTGLYVAGHITEKGESTLDVVKVIQRALSGVASDAMIDLRNNTILYDRGYGGTQGQVNNWSIRSNCHLLGTSQRMNSFPFTFDQAGRIGQNRVSIPEKGAPGQYWAKKPVPGHTFEQFAMANRSGLGRVVLMQTTMPKGVQRRCVWCCEIKHENIPIGKKHHRRGYKTTSKCGTCNVPLCIKVRDKNRNRTCFSAFHTSRRLNQPCPIEVVVPICLPANVDDAEEERKEETTEEADEVTRTSANKAKSKKRRRPRGSL